MQKKLVVAMNIVVVQLKGVDLKKEEVKQELLLIKEVLIAQNEAAITRWTKSC